METFAEIWMFKDDLSAYLTSWSGCSVNFKSNKTNYIGFSKTSNPGPMGATTGLIFRTNPKEPFDGKEAYDTGTGWVDEKYRKISLYEPTSGDFLSFLEQAAVKQ